MQSPAQGPIGWWGGLEVPNQRGLASSTRASSAPKSRQVCADAGDAGVLGPSSRTDPAGGDRVTVAEPDPVGGVVRHRGDQVKLIDGPVADGGPRLGIEAELGGTTAGIQCRGGGSIPASRGLREP